MSTPHPNLTATRKVELAHERFASHVGCDWQNGVCLTRADLRKAVHVATVEGQTNARNAALRKLIAHSCEPLPEGAEQNEDRPDSPAGDGAPQLTRIPSSDVGYCTGCRRKVTLLNVRDWPAFGVRIGECPTCHSTLTVQDGGPEAA